MRISIRRKAKTLAAPKVAPKERELPPLESQTDSKHNEGVMSSKSTSVSQEEIRFLLKDFPCGGQEDDQDTLYEAPFASPAMARERSIKRESLARQIRRLFAASMQHRT